MQTNLPKMQTKFANFRENSAIIVESMHFHSTASPFAVVIRLFVNINTFATLQPTFFTAFVAGEGTCTIHLYPIGCI